VCATSHVDAAGAKHFSGLTLRQFDHPTSPVPGGDAGGASATCEEVVYPVPAQYVANGARNWHDTGPYWSKWHSGTDLAGPCGTPVYAAHGGTIEVDTTQSWAGPWLVKVTTGARSLTTWYAHMQKITVSRGETVQPGQQIGLVGNEGNSGGCHLHFEVHLKNGSIYGPDNVDPSTWLDQNVLTKSA
jgi:murein DD-endopeptidase MepM/ murein hydrolase activator NlpD